MLKPVRSSSTKITVMVYIKRLQFDGKLVKKYYPYI